MTDAFQWFIILSALDTRARPKAAYGCLWAFLVSTFVSSTNLIFAEFAKGGMFSAFEKQRTVFKFPMPSFKLLINAYWG